MGRIVCEECRKRYDYDRDDFCPRCGAFNQPQKTWGVDAKGNVIRVDGLNEQNHADSFAHREVHQEKDVRRESGMDWRSGRKSGSARPQTPPSPQQGRSIGGVAQRNQRQQTPVGKLIAIIVGLILLFNIVIPFIMALFSMF